MSSQTTGFSLQQASGKKCPSNVKQQTRLEPQGQETNEIQARFPSNISTDSTRYVPSNRSLSEVRNPIFLQQTNGNSVKDSNSNRSSMDVSTCSYSTLIIHNDESLCSLGNREYPSPPPIGMKDRPRSYGEPGMQEITEIPDDYLNQSHVLKHLAKEMKIPSKDTSNNIIRDSTTTENIYMNNSINWNVNAKKPYNKSKSKSQPDLTKFLNSDIYNIETITRENAALKQQLLVCRMKVAKTQKLEDEVTNVYRVYEELVQSCERREKLERVARLRLQENLQKVQTLNRALKDQVDIFQTQLLTPSEHQLLVAQLFTQNKELLAAKERQDIELSAQQATLQEQRTHIGILDTALNNAQRNIRRLEEELRKKQLYIDRINPTHGTSQLKENERKMRLGYDSSKDSNRSGSSTNSDSKWQLQEKSNQFMSLDSGQKNIEDKSHSTSKLSLEKVQETDRILAEAKHDKLRYLEDVLQVHLKGLENRLTEKDALIRALQNQKICGSSFDSYNLSTDSFPLHPLRFNSPSFINASNTYHANLLDQSYGTNSSAKYNPVMSNVLATATAANSYGQSSSNYTQNLQNLTIPGSYSPNSSSYSTSFDQNTNSITKNSPNFNSSCSSYDNHYEDHMKKHIDEQLNKFETLQRGLCCFPSLNAKKPNQSLLSDDVSILSTNNSDAFLQKLAHLDHLERTKYEQDLQGNKGKTTEEIVLLEKQGRCSQKTRNNAAGNLAQVTHNVGQNMTDISNFEQNAKEHSSVDQRQRKERGNSLPPSALPRPPKSLKPPRKIDYKFQTSIKSSQPVYTIKKSSCESEFSSPDFSQSPSNYDTFKENQIFSKNDLNFQHKHYGTIKNSNEIKHFGFGQEFSKPDYKSTKKYQRLENNLKPKIKITESSSLKRSLLPNTQNVRDLYNLSDSGINADSSMEFFKSESDTSNSTRLNSKTSPKYLRFRRNNNVNDLSVTQNQGTTSTKSKSALPIAIVNSITNIPKSKHNSIGGRENRYHIQF